MSIRDFAPDQLELINNAIEVLMADGMDYKLAQDVICRNWRPDGNTVQSLTQTWNIC